MIPNLAADSALSLIPASPGRARRANLSNRDESGDQDHWTGRNGGSDREGGEPVRDAARRSSENRRSDLPGTVRGQSDRSARHLYRTCARNGCRNPVPNRYGDNGSPLCPECQADSA